MIDMQRLMKGPLAGAAALRLDRRRMLLGLGAAAVGAMSGDEPFKGGAAEAELRALARIGSAQVQVLVAGTSKAKSISDLKGKTIGFGPKLRDSAVTGAMVLAAYGITRKRAKYNFDE